MNFFGFMDETGVLSNDTKQPYFALGLLRLYDTSELLQKIMAIKAKHKGIITSQSKQDFMIDELKFSSLSTNKFLPLYKEVIEVCLSYENFYFSAFVIQKDKVRSRGTIWDTQLQLAKAHINQHCKNHHKISIIADYLNKPKEGLVFENEMRKLKQVFNACMLESNTSIFIQLVDLFVGAIVYRYRNPQQTSKRLNRAPKMQLVSFIEEKLEEKTDILSKEHSNFSGTLRDNFAIFGEKFYFSVYEK
ncbi:DUF3800 domain-containing protein [Helicobacter brantae]|uniref:DUF3800 domain-containing protein n=1 Tax=Helicobacter brantae TaxID=375927 RepID=A0A3D8J122_9HELI|nr:DUF3800 domain-containing protein [Helicobacter brantae]RDU70920.1 hypothetical protein CQA58_03850 [Helicobacter brantae]